MFRMTNFIASMLIAAGLFPAAVTAMPPTEGEPAFPLLSDEESWKRLPPAEKGAGQPLPSWARALAGPLPRTTAALLKLDFVQRTRSPLDPKLRAEMRWVAAHANHSAYAEAYAAYDARRAGLDDAAIDAFRRGDDSRLPAAEK